jgi:hypothetical protein
MRAAPMLLVRSNRDALARGCQADAISLPHNHSDFFGLSFGSYAWARDGAKIQRGDAGTIATAIQLISTPYSLIGLRHPA